MNKLIKRNVIVMGSDDKTSIRIRYKCNDQTEPLRDAMGFPFFSNNPKEFPVIKKTEQVQLNIWESNNEKICRTFHGFVFVYSINDRESFRNVEKLLKIYNERYNVIKKVLVAANANANADADAKRKIDFKEGFNLANNYGIEFFETSVKNNTNIDEIFNTFLIL